MCDVTADTIRVRLFGQFELSTDRARLEHLGTRKSTAIFAHLILHRGHAINRECIADLFWPDLEEAAGRKALRSDLWRIRKALTSIGIETSALLNVTRNDVAFRPCLPCRIDVSDFESQLHTYIARGASQLDDTDAEILENCLRLYRGDLLENDLSDWCTLQRQEFRGMYIHALELLMGYCEVAELWDGALAYGQEMISLDPLLEHVHFAMMRCHVAKADRGSAIRRFQELRKLMSDELGISPARDIQNYYDRLLRDRNSRSRTAAPGSNEHPPQLFEDTRKALQSVNQAAYLLDRISKSL